VVPQVQHFIGVARELTRGSNLLDETIAAKKGRVYEFSALFIHGGNQGSVFN
jgi:hypothetical protein